MYAPIEWWIALVWREVFVARGVSFDWNTADNLTNGQFRRLERSVFALHNDVDGSRFVDYIKTAHHFAFPFPELLALTIYAAVDIGYALPEHSQLPPAVFSYVSQAFVPPAVFQILFRTVPHTFPEEYFFMK